MVTENLFIYLFRVKDQDPEGHLATECAGLALA